jgi:hypothetical protein
MSLSFDGREGRSRSALGAKLVHRLASLPVRLSVTRTARSGVSAASVTSQTFTLTRRRV